MFRCEQSTSTPTAFVNSMKSAYKATSSLAEWLFEMSLESELAEATRHFCAFVHTYT